MQPVQLRNTLFVLWSFRPETGDFRTHVPVCSLCDCPFCCWYFCIAACAVCACALFSWQIYSKRLCPPPLRPFRFWMGVLFLLCFSSISSALCYVLWQYKFLILDVDSLPELFFVWAYIVDTTVISDFKLRVIWSIEKFWLAGHVKSYIPLVWNSGFTVFGLRTFWWEVFMRQVCFVLQDSYYFLSVWPQTGKWNPFISSFIITHWGMFFPRKQSWSAVIHKFNEVFDCVIYGMEFFLASYRIAMSSTYVVVIWWYCDPGLVYFLNFGERFLLLFVKKGSRWN